MGRLFDHQLAVEVHGHVLADKLDFEAVPLADRVVGDPQRLVAVLGVVPQAAGAFLVVPDSALAAGRGGRRRCRPPWGSSS